MRPLEFTNKVAVITGAGSGIGQALAMQLAAAGAHLALADIRTESLAATLALLPKTGLRISQHRVDVASASDVAAFPAAVLAAHGGVDLLFNNAGVALGGHFMDVSAEDFDWLFNINFHGVVRVTRAFLPHLLQRPGAHLTNIASLFSIVAPAGQSAYSASKFAVRGFSDALRHELAGRELGVSVVCPGGIATAIARNARMAASLPAEVVERQQARAAQLLRMPPERAAAEILAGVRRRKPRILVGHDARIGVFLERLMPTRYWSLIRGFTE
ncbi:MAG: SDR family NAD(P)-dependent oxidoreductase [Sinobacteraceae bacterium]|nr:SDR family NAD(P)-dependent oxidoreductase [Nevskiaceae bacterium]